MLSVASVWTLAGCGGDDTETDPQAFCDAVADLRDDDPFADLAMASPGEMRDAFDALRDAIAAIDAAAPAEAEVQAGEYLTVVDELIGLLRAAGYDPRALDGLAYRDATDRYTAAAVSVDNAADATCPP